MGCIIFLYNIEVHRRARWQRVKGEELIVNSGPYLELTSKGLNEQERGYRGELGNSNMQEGELG